MGQMLKGTEGAQCYQLLPVMSSDFVSVGTQIEEMRDSEAIPEASAFRRKALLAWG